MYEVLKRPLDLLSATLVFVVFSPLFIILPVLIKLDSPGPVFYRQRRVGQDGKTFYIFKFRNMNQNADQILIKDKQFAQKFKKKSGWKLDEDPRVTRVGKFLRKSSLDELPNIFNIFKGEMSMVGPRANRQDQVGDEIQEQLKNYPHLKSDVQAVLSVKPGLTGPWQVSGRNDLSWDERIKLDADYARRRSLWYDLLIILKTPFAMLNKW
jgi:lipopolysaccharide/colanic/teichoic acid biosynthesis glycosyltransferase